MAVPIAGGMALKQNGGLPKKNQPAPPNYSQLAMQQADMGQKAVDSQTAANRPNQSTPFASSQWQKGPDGQWTQSVGLNGPLAGANNALQTSAAEMLRQPLNFGGLQQLSTGELARDQAINAAYGQAASRLDPMWQQREQQNRTRLLNQGLQEGSAAWNRAMGNMGQERTDAYNQAMYGAIGQGTQAGQAMFNQSLAGRQQGLAELLRQRSQPMEELQALQGLTAMPGFSQAGVAQAPNLLGAGQAQYQADMDKYKATVDMWNQLAQAGMQAGMMAASDERMKQNVVRYPDEVFPGVPLASWEWRPEYENSGPTAGVIAQDLQHVLPEAVRSREDGMLMVDYGLLARLR